MPKKIVLCFDGTCNQPRDAVQSVSRSGSIEDEGITNILKLHLLLGGRLYEESGGAEQVSLHYSGVGTYGGKARRIFNGALALRDVGKTIRAGMEDLKRIWTPGAEVFLFGFSRGAAIARRFASQIHIFFDDPVPNVRFVGVFDTVASIGLPNLDDDRKPVSDVVFENGGTLAANVLEVLHLVSLDDRRKAFLPTLMNQDPRVTEIWLSGAHSDLGSGFRVDGLSDVALQLTLDEVRRRDLGLRVLQRPEVDLSSVVPPEADYAIDLDDLTIEPNLFGRTHTQRRLAVVSRLTLTTREPRVNVNGEASEEPPSMHWSVAERIYRDRAYRPKALTRRAHEVLHPDGSFERFDGLAAHLARGTRRLTVLAPGGVRVCARVSPCTRPRTATPFRRCGGPR